MIDATAVLPAEYPRLDRRCFLKACGCSLLALTAGGCASLAARPVPVRNGVIELVLADHPALGEPGGFLSILPGQDAEPLYVLALDGGEFSVLSRICTHSGCTVDVSGELLVCPCHGSTYDRQGKVLEGPAPLPLARYPARRTDTGTLIITVGSSQ